MFGKRSTLPDTGGRFSDGPRQAPPPPPAPRRTRRPRGGLLSLLSGVLTFAVVIGGILVFGLIAISQQVDKPGPLEADKIVMVPKATGTGEIATLLQNEGVIDNPLLFEIFSYVKRKDGQLKAGEFQFKARASIEETIDQLIGGKTILHSLTIPEGLTSEQIVARLRENDILVGDVNAAPREGSLMPDTYKFERGQTRQQILNAMSLAGRQALERIWSRRSPDLPIKTPQELVILASIVEKETGRGDERARVAGVFINRLQRRMKLQSDPTIVYGLVGGKGTLGRGITRAEIDRPTPYNTYTIEGLPPGPIANPGRAALEASANPAKTRELFFVADGSGGHAFAENYDQHQRHVARWRSSGAAKRRAPARSIGPSRRTHARITRRRPRPGRRPRGAPSMPRKAPRATPWRTRPGTCPPRRRCRASARIWSRNSRSARRRGRAASPRPSVTRRSCRPASACRRADAAAMTIKSMTGFARESGSTGPHLWAWEIRTVNGRGLDIRLRVPPGFEQVGEEGRRAVTASLSRGQCQLNLTLAKGAGEAGVRINRALVERLLASLADLPRPDGVGPATLDGLLSVRGVIEAEDEPSGAFDEALKADLTAAVGRLITATQKARGDEGAALARVLDGQLAAIEALVEAADRCPARRPEAVATRLAEQVAALFGASPVLDPQRLHQEAILLAAKADIREELDRLSAHVEAARQRGAKGTAPLPAGASSSSCPRLPAPARPA
jgi:UPF0755 protein